LLYLAHELVAGEQIDAFAQSHDLDELKELGILSTKPFVEGDYGQQVNDEASFEISQGYFLDVPDFLLLVFWHVFEKEF